MTEERKRYLDDLAVQLLMLEHKELQYVDKKFEEGMVEIARRLLKMCEENGYFNH